MLSSSRLRRRSVAIVPALLLASLAACGTKSGYGDTTVSGLDAFTVSGAGGKVPTIAWNAEPSYPDSVQTKTIVTGTGPAVAPSDQLEVSIYLSDPLVDLYAARTSCHATPSSSDSASPAGSAGAGAKGTKTKKAGKKTTKGAKATKTASPTQGAAPSTPATPSSSTSASVAPTPVTLTPCPDQLDYPVDGSWVYQSSSPEQLTPSDSSPIFQQALQGATVGSRIEILGGSPDILPAQQGGVAGNAQWGVGTHDPLVMVIDVDRIVPQLADKKVHDVSPSTLPKLTSKAGKPVGFDFTGITKPAENDTLKRATLKQGTGAVVKATDSVKVNYLGMTYGAKKPFDESYTKKPVSFALSGVVEGWGTGLTGVKVGSRVLLQIPPQLGYGSTAKPANPGFAPIPANSTLYFVVDVISATPAKK